MSNVIGTNPYIGIYYPPHRVKIVTKQKTKPRPNYNDYSDKLNFSQFNKKKYVTKWNHKPSGF
jgi:hypothetical protein